MLVGSSLTWSPVWAADPAAGAKVYETLSGGRYLDDYLAGMVGEITADLVRTANRWGGYQVNGTFRPGWVNVYLVDSGKLPDRSVLAAQGITLGRGDLEGSALTDEANGIVFIDTRMMKELVASTALKGTGPGQVDDIMAALAVVRVRGLDAVRLAWDPAQNAALRASPPGNRLQMLVGGALGFVIAHEMGHIAIGQRDTASQPQPPRPFTGKDRDVHNACPELIDPAHVAKQQLERAADDFAVGLLEQSCGSWAPHQPRHLVYELGARWYFLYAMSAKMLATGNVTESRNIHALLRMKLGPQLYDALIAQGERQDRGSVYLTYPTSHPPDYERADRLLARMSQSTCSLSRGEQGGSMEVRLLETFRGQACKDLSSKYSKR